MLDLWGRCARGKVQYPVVFLYYCYYYFKATAGGVCLGVVFKVLWSRIRPGSGILLSKEEERNIVPVHEKMWYYLIISTHGWTLLCPTLSTVVLLFIQYERVLNVCNVEQMPVFIFICFSFFLWEPSTIFLSSSTANQTWIKSHYLAFKFQRAPSRCFINLKISVAWGKEIAILILCCKLSPEPVGLLRCDGAKKTMRNRQVVPSGSQSRRCFLWIFLFLKV